MYKFKKKCNNLHFDYVIFQPAEVVVKFSPKKFGKRGLFNKLLIVAYFVFLENKYSTVYKVIFVSKLKIKGS